jgi:L-ascorbate metabolism protein UlaG (beta-lactamase superfamily)
MKFDRRSFLQSAMAVGLGTAGMGTAGPWGSVMQAQEVQGARRALGPRVHFIRHATCVLHYGGRVLLIDPMLGDPGVMPAIANSPNPRPNPLVPLPLPAARVLHGVEAVLVTHTHADHWDEAATKLVPKDTRLLIQPPDAEKFAQRGFTNVQAIETSTTWNGITIARTGGQHGRGDMARKLAPVSGFVLSTTGMPTVYIAGDTVWCPEVADAIEKHRPNVIVVNAGAAQFLAGGPITMDTNDVLEVCKAAPDAKVIAVHMEAINHCVLTRVGLSNGLPGKRTVVIPRDGAEVELA